MLPEWSYETLNHLTETLQIEWHESCVGATDYPVRNNMMVASAVRRILIVEDETDLANLLRAFLEDEGYQTATWDTGDCLDLVKSYRPDLIICDYMLPFYDGRQVLRQVREAGLDLPFIMISAVPRADRNWQEWGVDAFVPKPFDLDRLLESIDRVSRTGS
jgi:DNA-binding response OmpR family regulator